jgi:putative ATP-dependent endonuclease of the OLD family
MKFKEIIIKNIKSFKSETKIIFNSKLNILIGSNGGGKSNFLDIITICMRKYFTPYYSIQNNKNVSQISNTTQNYQLDKFNGNLDNSYIKITFIVTTEDIVNINNIIKNIQELNLKFQKYPNVKTHLNNLSTYEENMLNLNDEITFFIEDDKIDIMNNRKENLFYQYLNIYNLLQLLDMNNKDVIIKYTNFLFISPNRNINVKHFQFNLSSSQYDRTLVQHGEPTSKEPQSLIPIAAAYFSSKKRTFEMNDNETTKQLWNSDTEVNLINKYLKRINYEWKLKLHDADKNIYKIDIYDMNSNSIIELNQLSSGEKEILNYIFGIFALNVKNGIIIVDEPEIHLHPKWQKLLLNILLEICEDTGSQIVIATHSPSFINDQTCFDILRFFKNENNETQVIKSNNYDEIKQKNILLTINATNNEKIFFADKIILVEGITDKLIFQKILDTEFPNLRQNQIIEIIEIGGKHNYKKFKEYIETLKIPLYYISDIDSLNEYGNEKIRSFLKPDYKKIKTKVIKDKNSIDGKNLLLKLNHAIKNKNFNKLEQLWDYIKERNSHLNVKDLNEEELNQIENFISELELKNIYILKLGEIEDYFPFKCDDKISQELLDLITDDDAFNNWRNSKEYETIYNQLKTIIEKIIKN